MRQILCELMSFGQLKAASATNRPYASDPSSSRATRGKKDVNARSIRVMVDDNDNEAWAFRYKSNAATSTTNKPYHGLISFFKNDVSNNEDVSKLNCEVKCDCPDYKYRFEYNNAKIGAGRISQSHNGAAPEIYKEVGLCKHLCALTEFLNTTLDAPTPETSPTEPTSKTTEPSTVTSPKPSIPSTISSPKTITQPKPPIKYVPLVKGTPKPQIPTTSNAPSPDDDIDTYGDKRSGLNESKTSLYDRFVSFIQKTPTFEVPYE